MERETGEYGLGEVVQRPRPPRVIVPRGRMLRRKVRRPRWSCFRETLAFPWSLEVLPFWALTSIGFMVLAVFLRFILIIVFTAYPLFAVTVLTVGILSCVSAGWRFIMEETIAGSDSIVRLSEGVSEGDWRDWVIDLAHLVWLVTWAGIGGLFVGELFHWVLGASLLPAVGAFVILFPILALSSLEAESRWLPLSLPIASSLKTCWRAWLTFELLSMILLTVCLATVTLLAHKYPWTAVFVASPLIAAAALVYVRWLGYLARFVIADAESGQRSKQNRCSNPSVM